MDPKKCVLGCDEPGKPKKQAQPPQPSPPAATVAKVSAPVKRAPEKVEIRSDPVQMASFDQMLEEEEAARRQSEEEAKRAREMERLRLTRISAKPLVYTEGPTELIPTLLFKLEFLREELINTTDITAITNLAIAIKEVANAVAACKKI